MHKNMRNYIRIFLVLILIFGGKLSLFSQTKNSNYKNINLSIEEQLYSKATILGKEGKLDSALNYAIRSVDLHLKKESIDSILLANTYQSLGIIYKIMGKYDKAIEYYSLAESIYKEKQEHFLLAFIYSNKANIFKTRQDYSKSEIYQKQAIQTLESDSIKYKNQLGNFYNNLANVYKKKGKYADAIEFYNKNIKIKGITNSYISYGNLAYCYNELNQYEKSEFYYKLAVETVQERFTTPNNKVAQQLVYYATFLGSQNRISESKQLFDKALEIYSLVFGEKHPEISYCYNSIGELYLKNNELDDALKYFQKSLIALSGNFNEEHYSKNPDVNDVSSETHLLRSLKNKASTLYKISLNESSEEKFILSLKTSELATELFSKVKQGYVSEESKLFLTENEFSNLSLAINSCNELFKLTDEDKYIEKAFLFSELGKSSVLNETMNNAKALKFGGIPDSLLLKEKNLEKSIWNYEELIYEEENKKNPDGNKLKFWNKYLFEHKQEYSNLIEYFENNYNEYHNFKHNQNDVSLKEIQRKLALNENVVEYFLTDTTLFTFLIKKNKVHFFEAKIDSTFYGSVSKFIESTSDNNFSHHKFKEFNEFQNSSFDLYKTLIKPISPKIGSSSLIIIPDGVLSYISFEALTTNHLGFKKIRYRELPYLIYQNPISYAHSVNFIHTNSKKSAIKALGAFAPNYKVDSNIVANKVLTRQHYRENLHPLKGVQDEVINITNIIGGDRYIDDKANETIFKEIASNYDILHLAMHTIIDDNNPMYSKMAFTQSKNSIDDGFLNTYELYDINLNSRMAVLSSCNSGSGKLQRGEGVISLARGFIYAGCPSIVMTLWPVEDKSGVELMTNFYKWLDKGYSKSESLQKAKIEFIHSGDQLKSHPYFWSGYVVIGNNNALFHNKLNTTIYLSIAVGIVLLLGLFFVRKKRSN